MLWIIASAVVGLVIAYFAGVFTPKATSTIVASPTGGPSSPTAVKPAAGTGAANSATGDVLILFGSQTGTAEMYAKTLHREGGLLGVGNKLQDIEEYTPHYLNEEKLVIFVVATYGEGEPTDTMKPFYDWVMEESRYPGELENLKYAVFGLGDRQFKFFCHVGVELDKRLAELGAQRIYGLGCGDAGRNMEEEFDSWRKELWPCVGHALGIKLKEETEEPYECELKLKYVEDAAPQPFPKVASAIEPTQKHPVYATIGENRELLNNCTDRSTRFIAFDISDTLISYQAGDHLGVLPRNNSAMVQQYIDRLGIADQAERVITLQDKKFKNVFPARVTVRDALTWYVDLSGVPKKSTLRALAHCCTDPKERAEWLALLRVTPEATEQYRKLIGKLRTVFGFLRKFSSCAVPLHLFLEVMPRMAPRYFSIASDQLCHPKSVHAIAALVEGGVCTTMLAGMQPGDRVPVFVRKSNFHLPLRAKNRPVIMVGPGTGVAPLVGFLHRRRVWKEKGHELGPAMLFFGCRKASEDFVMGDVMTQALADGVISHLELAFSRDQEAKIYVQHRIKAAAATVWNLLSEGGANLYICGDAKHMAKDVEATLLELIMAEGGKSKDEATKFIAMLEEKERFLKDVWSA